MLWRAVLLKLIRKIKTAGMLQQVAQYPRIPSRGDAVTRSGCRKLSSEAQQRMNVKYSWQNLMWRIAANFSPGDLVVTLTYDDEHLPDSRKRAKADLKRFRGNMSQSRRKKGEVFKAVYCTEHLHPSSHNGENGRWHHHLVINRTKNDYTEIIAAWPYGVNIEIHPFELNDKRSYESIAKYMAKERADTVNSHVWGCTRNCQKPDEESFLVDAGEVIRVPDGAMYVRQESRQTEFGRYDIASWICSDPKKMMKPRRRRKK